MRGTVRYLGMAMLALFMGTACLSARAVERNFYLLHGDPILPPKGSRPVDGLVRVRDMDTPSVYEKFQIVVRRSPYQLRYSDQNVWAVKPNQMISDVVANALESSNSFTNVTRQLLDARPSYTISGKVQAIELYDSGDLWFAHLSIHLHLTRFGDGASIWAFEFDKRKEIAAGEFDHGVRALSELLYQAISAAIQEMQYIDSRAARRAPARTAPARAPTPVIDPPKPSEPDVVYVPELPLRPPAGTPAHVLTGTAASANPQRR